MTKVTNISGIFLVIHILFWALHYQDYWNSLTFFFVIAQIWHISILMISYPHYLNYSFLSFLELKKYHLSYQITQITKIVNLFQEQNDKIVTIVTNIIHRIFSVWKKLAHIEPCLHHCHFGQETCDCQLQRCLEQQGLNYHYCHFKSTKLLS